MIHVLIRGRNCEKYIKKCLISLSLQNVPWNAFILLDNPTDSSIKVAKEAVAELDLKRNVGIHVNKTKLGLGYNMWVGVLSIVRFKIVKPDDIIAVIDADDTIEPRAFNVVERVYTKYPDTLVTHGSYIKKTKNRKTRVSKPYPLKVNFRKHPWRASHLKTFKVKLWLHMKEEYFQHNGVWAEAASDLALMLPLMELAGRDRIRHIKEPIYIWRDNYKQSTNPGLQKKWDKIIRSKPPLQRLTDGEIDPEEEIIG